jgi:N,N'-diacetyllegionaminate synthase
VIHTIRIGNRTIGEDEPCFIIAEAGVNHNGNTKLAKKLIDMAKDAGADAVKFQTFRAEEVVTRTAKKAEYQRETTGSGESQYEMIRKLELSERDFRLLANYATERQIMFLSTPFDRGSVDLLADLDVPAFKIASGEITDFPLIKHIAQKGKPIILSTGMSTLVDIREAIGTIRDQGTSQIVLLHCVSEYPARAEEVNLRAMATLRKIFKVPVGLSDHTVGTVIPIAAVALGAAVMEKHFTLDKDMEGPDHRASLNPVELKEMVEGIRKVESSLGDGRKSLTDGERDTRRVARRSIVACMDIPEGTLITPDMVAAKRPGTGIAPKYLDRVVGCVAAAGIARDELVTWRKLTGVGR